MTKVNPLSDNILVKRLECEDKIGNIVIPDTAKKKSQRGKVLAVGPGKYVGNTKERRSLSCEENDVVLFSIYAGTEVNPINGEKDLVLIHEEDVLAILTEKK